MNKRHAEKCYRYFDLKKKNNISAFIDLQHDDDLFLSILMPDHNNAQPGPSYKLVKHGNEEKENQEKIQTGCIYPLARSEGLWSFVKIEILAGVCRKSSDRF